MKKIICTILVLFIVTGLRAQTSTVLPVLHLLKTDSTYFTQDNLKKNSKVMVIYFGTDCIHCKLYTKELFKHMDVLSKIQILMVTWSNLQSIKEFYKEFELAKYPNFTVTTEGYTYNLYRFFQVKTTPYTAVYDKNHQLIKAFDKSPVIDSLLAAVKK